MARATAAIVKRKIVRPIPTRMTQVMATMRRMAKRITTTAERRASSKREKDYGNRIYIYNILKGIY